MDIVVRFPDDADEFEALVLVRDALMDFAKLRAYPMIDVAVLRDYPEPHFDDQFRAGKVASRERRIGWAREARVLSFDDSRNPDFD